MKRIIFLSAFCSISLLQANEAELQKALSEKLSLFATEVDIRVRTQLIAEIEEIKTLLNQNTQLRENAVSGPAAAIGSTPQNLDRQTYYYRGPVNNPTNNTPFLDTSMQRGYGSDTYVLEGRPVYMPYGSNYVNEVPNIGGDPYNNARLSYGGASSGLQGPAYQTPGSSYFPLGYQYIQNQSHYGYGQQPYSNMYNTNMYNMPNYGYGQQPYANMYGTNYAYGQQPYANMYGTNYAYGQYQNNNVNNEEYLNNQTMYLTSFDAKQRFLNEIRLNPALGTGLNVDVTNQVRLEDGRIQVIVRTSGSATGLGNNTERIYIYSASGSFLEAREKPVENLNFTSSALQIKTYQLSRQQMSLIEQYLSYNRLNEYGDPFGTVYTGGSPLGLVSDQSNDGSTRYNYILHKIPALLNLFDIK